MAGGCACAAAGTTVMNAAVINATATRAMAYSSVSWCDAGRFRFSMRSCGTASAMNSAGCRIGNGRPLPHFVGTGDAEPEIAQQAVGHLVDPTVHGKRAPIRPRL